MDVLFFAGAVDLLSAVNIHTENVGVEKTGGYCTDRAGKGLPDLAFNITKEAQLSATTYQVYPCEYSRTLLSLINVLISLNF